ncbi:DapH/DapD/GlmU-related protein [Frondihabitans sp. PAMC 28766]|uniref:acyltransferase n=1 Tax=Frondihabitans sp. PAMC 28766 TaxID=1795630 RepID=UPI0026D0B774
MTDYGSHVDRGPAGQGFGYVPWEFRRSATADDRAAQTAHQAHLASLGDATFGNNSYVDPSAAVYCTQLTLGPRSYIAARAYVTDDVTIGADSTINPSATVRGKVTIGDGVRIAPHASLYAYNHGLAPDRPIFQQPLTSVGITIGDDVWIGTGSVVVDGVTVGSHAVIGAGAIVTKDVDEWSIMGGNPARRLGDRRTSSRQERRGEARDIEDRLASFGDMARRQADVLIARCYDGERFVDRPGAAPSIRPWCDAIEIADLLLHSAPEQHGVPELIERLRLSQDPASGAFITGDGDLATGPVIPPAGTTLATVVGSDYHMLSVGYALRLLGSSLAHPISLVSRATTPEILTFLAGLPWDHRAWNSGALVDFLGTAIWNNATLFDDSTHLETVVGWLQANVDPATGMWGSPPPTKACSSR